MKLYNYIPTTFLLQFLFINLVFGQFGLSDDWTYEDLLEWEQLPEFNGDTRQDLKPYDPSITHVNIRENLLQQYALIKDQDEVPTCVHNSITTALEYFLKREIIINHGWKLSSFPIDLSAEQVIGCTTGPSDTKTYKVMQQMIDENTNVIFLRDDEKPQTSTDKEYYRCDEENQVWVRIKEFEKVENVNEEEDIIEIKQLLQNNIPVMASLYFMWADADDEILTGLSDKKVNHSIVIVGYQVQSDPAYSHWICQNSLGSNAHGSLKGFFVIPYRGHHRNIQNFKYVNSIKISQEFKNTIHLANNFKFVKIPSSPEKNILSLFISQTEVTQNEYSKITGKYHSNYRGLSRSVENVTFYDAVLYCNAKSTIEGFNPVYIYTSATYDGENCIDLANLTSDHSKNGYRLPTPEEWTYAYRAGTTTIYYWGDTFDGAYVWHSGNSNMVTHIVGTRLPNAWRIYDMAGNVEEMTWSPICCEGLIKGGCFGNSYDSKLFKADGSYPCNFEENFIFKGFRIVRKVPPDITPINNLLLLD